MIEPALLGWLLLVFVGLPLIALAIVLYASIVITFALIELFAYAAVAISNWAGRRADGTEHPGAARR